MKKWELARYMTELGKKGGVNRAKALSAERRTEIARLGGLARQKKSSTDANGSPQKI